MFRIIYLKGDMFRIIYLKGDFPMTAIFSVNIVIHRVRLTEDDDHAIGNSVWNIAYNLVQLFKLSHFL